MLETVEVNQFVEASPEIVFNFLADPDEFVKWQGISARFDPRPGGEFWLMVAESEIAAGEFVEIDPPNRLVFTWGWSKGRSKLAPGSTTIEVTLTPKGEGTDVCLRHHGLPPSEVGHATGHRHYLGRLADAAAGRDPGVDPWIEQLKQSAGPVGRNRSLDF